jgi:hypothetical protein
MTNMMLATPLFSDGATLSGSAVAASLPLSNLQRTPIGRITRFITPGAVRLVIDLGDSSKAANLVALLSHNGSIWGTARVRAANTEADLLGSPIYDSEMLPVRSNIETLGYDNAGSLEKNHFIHALSERIIARYWSIDVSDAGLPYFDVGRLYVSEAFQPSVNMDYGTQEGIIDPSAIQRTVGGRVVPLERKKYRFISLQLSFGSEDEMFGALYQIDSTRGTTRDVLFIHDCDKKPLLQKRTIYGRMSEMNPVTNDYYRLFQKSYRIEEIIE